MIDGRLPSNRTLPQGRAPPLFLNIMNDDNYLANNPITGAGGFVSNQPAALLYNCFGSLVNQAPFLLADEDINLMKARVSDILLVPPAWDPDWQS